MPPQGVTEEDVAKALSRLDSKTDSANPGPDLASPEQRSGSEQGRKEATPTTKAAPEPKTEFQKFVFTTTGAQLYIFGASFFDNAPNTFAPVDRIPVPANYVIGPGDELLIRAWGQIDFNAKVSVDRNGQVYLPRVGAINVAGVRYEDLTQHLKNSVGRLFKNFDLNVTIGQLRSIQVYVVGQARHPGSYTVSSLSTLVNALFASGGPSSSGSLRHIQLKRQGQLVSEFDMYDLLTQGDKSKDSTLLPGDVIYIPPSGPRVALMGSVNVPAIYEIKENSTLRKQLETAGGLSTTADGTKVIIERIDSRSSRSVEEFKLEGEGLSQLLRDGDIVHIFAISPRVTDGVTLRGSVANPGRVPWHQGMKISDLIPSRDALITRDYWMKESLLSRDRDGWANPKNNKPDALQADTNQSETLQQTSKEAEARAREQRSWSDGQLSPARVQLERNSADINWDYAVIQRMDKQDLSIHLISFNLANAISDFSSADNKELEPGDIVTVFSQNDVSVPTAKRTKLIWIEGEVPAAGVYRVQPGETLRDVVARAGGLTKNAYLYATDFRRVSTRVDQQKRLEQAVDEMQKQLQARSTALLNSARGSAEEALAAKEQIGAEQKILDRLRATRATGRVVLDMKPGDNSLEELPQIALEDGDTVTIPPRPATITVVGAVYNQNSFLYRSGSALRQYLNQAGGPTREADRDRTFVIRADGSVVSAQMHRSIWSGGFEALKLEPGDTAVVPERIKTGSVLKSLRDWSQVFAQFAIGAAAIQVLKQ